MGLLHSAQRETSEADRDAMEREDYWSMSEEFIDRHRALPRKQSYVLKESSFQIPIKYMDIVRQTNTNLEEGSVDDLWTIDGH